MDEYLPLRIMRFPKPDGGDADIDDVVLGQVTESTDELTEIAFTIGRTRYYVAIRRDDLHRLALPGAPQ